MLSCVCEQGITYFFYLRPSISLLSGSCRLVYTLLMARSFFFPHLDRMLDELQRSISPQRRTEPSRIEVGRQDTPVSSVQHQSSSKSVIANHQLAQQAVSQTSIARRLFDTSDQAARSPDHQPHLPHLPHLPVEGQTDSYNVSFCWIISLMLNTINLCLK